MTEIIELPTKGSRLHFTFGVGAELHVVAQSDSPTSESAYSNLRWGVPGQAERKTLYDILPIFQELHQTQLRPLSSDTQRQTLVLEYARRVSASLASVLHPTDHVAGEVGIGRAVWDALTVFYVRGSPHESSNLADVFAEFVRRNLRNLPGAESARFFQCGGDTSFLSSSTPEAHEAFWSLAAAAAAIGSWNDLKSLLQRHSAVVNKRAGGSFASGVNLVLESVLGLISQVPRYLPGATVEDYVAMGNAGIHTTNSSDHQYKRRAWVEQCRTLLLQDKEKWALCLKAHPQTAAGLETLLKIFVGDAGAIEGATGCRWDLAAATALHVLPELQYSDVATLCSDVAAKRPVTGAAGEAAEAQLWSLLRACAEGNVEETLRLCSLQCSQAVLAHVCDLLASHGPFAGVARPLMNAPLRELPGSTSVESCTQAERFLVTWAMSLAANESTWKAATSYLCWCPVYGESLLDALIRLRPSSSTLHLAPTLALCAAQGMHDTARHVQLSAAVTDLQQGRLQQALRQAVQVDPAHANLVAWVALLKADTQAMLGTRPASYRGTLGTSSELQSMLTTERSALLSCAASAQRVLERSGKAWVSHAVSIACSEDAPAALRWAMLQVVARAASAGAGASLALTQPQAEGLLRALGTVSEADAADEDDSSDDDDAMGEGSGSGEEEEAESEEEMGEGGADHADRKGERLEEAQVRTIILQLAMTR